MTVTFLPKIALKQRLFYMRPFSMLLPCHSIAATVNGEPATASAVIKETSPRLSDVKRSVFAIGSAVTYLLLYWECATPPHIHVRHCT